MLHEVLRLNPEAEAWPVQFSLLSMSGNDHPCFIHEGLEKKAAHHVLLSGQAESESNNLPMQAPHHTTGALVEPTVEEKGARNSALFKQRTHRLLSAEKELKLSLSSSSDQ